MRGCHNRGVVVKTAGNSRRGCREVEALQGHGRDRWKEKNQLRVRGEGVGAAVKGEKGQGRT